MYVFYFQSDSEYCLSEDNCALPQKPNPEKMSPKKLLKTHKCKTLDITQKNYLRAELVTKIDDKFDNPMGLGVSKKHIIIANSCEDSVVVYDLRFG